jgi:hypothetical protein
MKTPREQLEYLQWSAIDKINRRFDAASFEDRHLAIQTVRHHLESRAAQTAVPFVLRFLKVMRGGYGSLSIVEVIQL